MKKLPSNNQSFFEDTRNNANINENNTLAANEDYSPKQNSFSKYNYTREK
jgi:hypothetical protein